MNWNHTYYRKSREILRVGWGYRGTERTRNGMICFTLKRRLIPLTQDWRLVTDEDLCYYFSFLFDFWSDLEEFIRRSESATRTGAVTGWSGFTIVDWKTCGIVRIYLNFHCRAHRKRGREWAIKSSLSSSLVMSDSERKFVTSLSNCNKLVLIGAFIGSRMDMISQIPTK